MMQGNTGNLNAHVASRGSFIKETVKPGVSIDTSQKALLNRKGNVLFNEGNIEGARRIFVTTGYSDGLSRIGDYYRKQGKVIDALQMYRIAPDKRKADELVMSIASFIRSILAGRVPFSGGKV
jgi:hypothetical protein